MTPQPVSTSFEFDGKSATIAAMKMRKAVGTDAAIAAVELKIAVEGLPISCMAALLAVPADHVAAAFWAIEDADKIDTAKGDKLDRRFLAIDVVECETAYEERHELKINGVPAIRCALVDRFRMTPVAGQTVDITFRAVVSDPPSGWLDATTHKFLQKTLVTLRQDADMFNAAPKPDDTDAKDAERVDAAANAIAADIKSKRKGKRADEGENDGLGDLYEQATVYANAAGKLTVEGLRNGLKISYVRAAQLIEQMQVAGVIGPQDREGVRELLDRPAAKGAAASQATAH